MSTFNVVHVRNAFNPSDCWKEERELEPGRSLAELFPPNALSVAMSISVNGRVIPDDELATTQPAEGDYVVLCPVPAGGDNSDGKTILRVVAFIVVAYFTAGAGNGWLVGANSITSGLVTAGSLGAAFVVAGATMAGAMLINALLPPPKAKKSDEDSPSYGIDGPKNTSAEGIVVPVNYGQFRMAGNILNNYVVNAGDTQYLYLLLNMGEGPIASLTDIQIDDQPIGNYKDWEVRTALGTADQQPIDWFASTITPQSVQRKLTTDWQVSTTNGEVDKIRLDFLAPAGFWQLKSHTDHEPTTVIVEVQHRKVGTTTWTNLVSTLEVDSRDEVIGWLPGYVPDGTETRVGDNYFKTYTYTAGGQTEYETSTTTLVGSIVRNGVYSTSGQLRVTGNSTNPFRASVMSDTLPEGVYEIRYRRTDAEAPLDGSAEKINSLYLSDINEIALESVGYRNTALLALKIRLSDQLNGMPNVTALNGGRVVTVWDFATGTWVQRGTSNPAWITLDILTNKRYAGGASFSRIDMTAWKDWAAYCDTKKLTYNGPFDVQTNVWDAANQVARCGHAQIMGVGTKYSVVIERAAAPTMMFSVANMVKGSFKSQWLPMSDRANEIQMTFSDKADNYTPHTVRLYDQAALAAGAPQRTSTVEARGIVTLEDAYRELQLMLNLNRYIQRTVTFSAPLEAIVCKPGQVVLVQHDMPQWGFGGRLEAGSSTTQLKLDRKVTLESGKTYQAMVHYDSMQIASGVVQYVASNNIYFAAGSWDGNGSPKRLLINGKDIEILAYVTASIYHGVTVDPADMAGIAAGNAYQLHDTNVLVTRNVANPAPVGGFVDTQTITLQSALPSAPGKFKKWLFGPTNKVAKPFRVKQISGGAADYNREITAVEYNASIYDGANAVPTLNYSSLQDKQVLPVLIDGVGEVRVRSGSSYESRITISWHSSQQSYQDAEVFLSRNGDSFRSVGRAINSLTVVGVKGEQLVFRVVPRDRFGRNAPVSSAASYTYTVLGKIAVPDDVTGFAYAVEQFGIRLRWTTAVTDLALDHYALRFGGTSWETATNEVNLRGSTYLWEVQAAGNLNAWIKAIDAEGNASANAAHVTVVIDKPLAPFVEYQLSGPDEIISWNIPLSGFVVDHYEIRMSTGFGTFETATPIDTTKATSWRRKVTFSGTRTYYVSAVDAAGNVGFYGSVSTLITLPGPVRNARAEVVDNNALLYWDSPDGHMLPIDYYDVRKGATYETGTPVGSNGNSTFTTVFEQQAGTYSYWVVPVDSAGNTGPAVAITATVTQPPDYILRTNIDSAFGGTLTNLYVENGKLVGPVVTGESFDTHFTGNGWDSPQDQINAGFPLFAMPATKVGTYSEVFDYGAVLPSTTVTATIATTTLAGVVNTYCQIAYKLNLGDPWINAAPGATAVLISNFRYVRVSYSFVCNEDGADEGYFGEDYTSEDYTSAQHASLIRVDSLNLKLASKQRTDSGAGVAAVGGTVVNFNYPFVAADTPVVQPNGGAPLIPVVIFTGGPNPTGFTVRLYDLTGTDVGGSFSWTARGY